MAAHDAQSAESQRTPAKTAGDAPANRTPRKTDPCPVHGADCKRAHAGDAHDVWRYWQYDQLQRSAARNEARAIAPETQSWQRRGYLDAAAADRFSAFHLFA